MKKQPKNKVLFLIPVGVILAGAVIFLCTRGNENDSVCKENVARLQALENSDISQTEEQLQALKQTTGISSGSDASDGSGSTLLSDVEIRQVFAGNVIIGDSITESIVEYGYLDTDVVVSKRGLNVGAADDQISTAIALNPSHVFMAFGSNDLEIYGSASSEFIDAYRTQIKKIQTALPDVPIYINCILPITDEAIAQTPDLGYYPDYNEGLIKLCQEMGCTFIDNSTIVTDSSENLYEPDGEHVIQDYYPKWLTNMAQIAQTMEQDSDITSLNKEARSDLKHYYQTDDRNIDGYFFYKAASPMAVEEICIMKATDNTQANTLLENANAHLSGQKQVFEGYGTDQMALLNNAVVGKKGNYVYYMCGADAQNWRTAFLSMI